MAVKPIPDGYHTITAATGGGVTCPRPPRAFRPINELSPRRKNAPEACQPTLRAVPAG
jgi:hypothetical protein